MDQTAYLNQHNFARTLFGTPDLSWSDELQAKAQDYAENCQLKHSDGALGPFGEALAAATGTFTASSAVQLFLQDGSKYTCDFLSRHDVLMYSAQPLSTR